MNDLATYSVNILRHIKYCVWEVPAHLLHQETTSVTMFRGLRRTKKIVRLFFHFLFLFLGFASDHDNGGVAVNRPANLIQFCAISETDRLVTYLFIFSPEGVLMLRRQHAHFPQSCSLNGRWICVLVMHCSQFMLWCFFTYVIATCEAPLLRHCTVKEAAEAFTILHGAALL